MTISAFFQDEINLVDATKILTFVSDGTYAPLEWSYNGLEIRGGSDIACEHGASELLEAMGFRYYAPSGSDFRIYPVAIATNLIQAKTKKWISARFFLVYGHSYVAAYEPDRVTLNNAFSRWTILNGVTRSVYPAGHRWINIIGGVNALSSFFTNNPQYLSDVDSFALATLTAGEYTTLVEICAAWLLRDTANWNEFGRTHFDPSDGDGNTSDLVFPFVKAVGAKCRAGTAAIAGMAAQTARPSAEVGVYAYAGHRLPPTLSIAPEGYTQVALGFNNTSLSYQELVEAHAARASAIAIREYLDTIWSDGNPLANARAKIDYFDRYDPFVAVGAQEANCEFTGHWLINLVFARYCVRKFADGTYSWSDALSDVTTNLFNGDQAAIDLYTFWSDPFQGFHKYNLRSSFELVDEMQDATWYKPLFQDLMVILYEQLYLPPQLATDHPDHDTPADPFPDAFSALMTKIMAVRLDDTIHSYERIRQLANTNVNGYPDLKFSANPVPGWMATPIAPTEAQFIAYLAAIQADTVRDAALDSEDLVLVSGITPRPPSGNVAASSTFTIGTASYRIIGPCTVTMTECDDFGVALVGGEVIVNEYGPGMHILQINGIWTAECSTGLAFLDTFFEVRKDPHVIGAVLGDHYMYFHAAISGSVDIEAISRWRFGVSTGVFDLLPSTDVSYADPSTLEVGQLRVDRLNTRGSFRNTNAPRFLSMRPDMALLPRAIAEAEFSSLLTVNQS